MKTSDKSAAHETRFNEMNETGESSALFYSPSRRSREQIDRDVSQGRVYPLADVLFKFLFGRPERSELFLDLLNALMFPIRAAPGGAGVPQQLLHPQRRERKASLQRPSDRLF